MVDKELVAQTPGGMREFDPECERHYVLLIIKAVDPGCTLELQVECADGRVFRDTTRDDPASDKARFKNLILEQFDRMWETRNV